MKKFILYTIVALFCLSIVSAADIDITPIDDEIARGEKAQFLVEIDNQDLSIQDYRVYLPAESIEWTLESEENIKAYPEKETSYKLVLSPTKYVKHDLHGVKINFKSEEETVEKILYINLKEAGQIQGGYSPSISLSLDMPKKTVPTEKLSIDTKLENQNIVNHSDLSVRISSDNLPALDTVQEVALGPLARKSVEFTYDMNNLQEPGTYSIEVTLLKAGEEIGISESKTLEIEENTPMFEKETVSDSSFLKKASSIIYTSQSNVKDTQTIKIPTGIVSRFFTYTEPESEMVKEDGERYLQMSLTLDPGESRTITVITSYRLLFIILFLAILGTAAYYTYRAPVIVKKGVSNVEIKEGGISNIRVTLEIKNISKKSLKSLKVTDYIPNIADLEKNFIEGTLKPSKVLKHEKRGTVLKWDIEELAPGEERIISYNLQSRLSILGNFKLPRAKANYKGKGKEKSAYSNSAAVSS